MSVRLEPNLPCYNSRLPWSSSRLWKLHCPCAFACWVSFRLESSWLSVVSFERLYQFARSFLRVLYSFLSLLSIWAALREASGMFTERCCPDLRESKSPKASLSWETGVALSFVSLRFATFWRGSYVRERFLWASHFGRCRQFLLWRYWCQFESVSYPFLEPGRRWIVSVRCLHIHAATGSHPSVHATREECQNEVYCWSLIDFDIT